MDNSNTSGNTPDNSSGSYVYGEDSTRSFDPNAQYGQNAQPAQYGQAGQYGQNPGFAQQAQYNQPFGAYPNPQQANQTGASSDSFFGALFDFSFTKYATPSVAKALYILWMVVIGLVLLLATFGIIVGSTDDDAGPAMLLILPVIFLVALLYLAMARVGLEVGVSMIRTSQSVQAIDKRHAEQVAQSQTAGNTNGWGGQL